MNSALAPGTNRRLKISVITRRNSPVPSPTAALKIRRLRKLRSGATRSCRMLHHSVSTSVARVSVSGNIQSDPPTAPPPIPVPPLNARVTSPPNTAPASVTASSRKFPRPVRASAGIGSPKLPMPFCATPTRTNARMRPLMNAPPSAMLTVLSPRSRCPLSSGEMPAGGLAEVRTVCPATVGSGGAVTGAGGGTGAARAEPPVDP